jgi:NAD(P)H dehydrogenase (quinone)
MPVKVAIIYYSATGITYQLARAVMEGAEAAGAEVRLHRVRELASDEEVASNAGWSSHRAGTVDVAEATHDDLIWADALIFGTPTRFGNVSAQLKQFIDTAGPLWREGQLADKVVSGFVSTGTFHGGQESTLLALYTSMYHWGAIIVAPGYTAPVQWDAGNPYGASSTSNNGQLPPSGVELRAARYLGQRTAEVAHRFVSGSTAPPTRTRPALQPLHASPIDPRPFFDRTSSVPAE